MTFTQIKQNIKDNLNDQGVFFTVADMNTAVQKAYDLTIALSQCIVKKTTLNFQDNTIYYNFQDNANYPNTFVADFMACTAIFNNLTNLWLLDDKALKDFSRDRIDWENWRGQPVWWCPTGDYRRVALIPNEQIATGDFDLYYWAQAPTVIDGDTPVMPSDFHYLIEVYANASLCEVAREYVKAQKYLDDFYGLKGEEQDLDQGIHALAARAKNIAQSDLLMLA